MYEQVKAEQKSVVKGEKLHATKVDVLYFGMQNTYRTLRKNKDGLSFQTGHNIV